MLAQSEAFSELPDIEPAKPVLWGDAGERETLLYQKPGHAGQEQSSQLPGGIQRTGHGSVTVGWCPVTARCRAWGDDRQHNAPRSATAVP
jgi:hypothetical protein